MQWCTQPSDAIADGSDCFKGRVFPLNSSKFSKTALSSASTIFVSVSSRVTKRCQNTKCFHLGLFGPICSGRYCHLCEIWARCRGCFANGTASRANDLTTTIRDRPLHRLIWNSNIKHKNIKLVIAERIYLFVRRQFRYRSKPTRPSSWWHQFFERLAMAGARISNVNPLSLQIIPTGNTSVTFDNHLKWFWINGKHCAKACQLFAAPITGPAIRMELPVRLRHGERDFALCQSIQVSN